MNHETDNNQLLDSARIGLILLIACVGFIPIYLQQKRKPQKIALVPTGLDVQKLDDRQPNNPKDFALAVN